MASETEMKQRLVERPQELQLPTFRECFEDTARPEVQELLSYEQYLGELAAEECQMRRTNRIQRWLRDSDLPVEKSLVRFDMKRLPAKVARQARMSWMAPSSMPGRTCWHLGDRAVGKRICYVKLRKNSCVPVARFCSARAAYWCKIY